MDLLVKQVQKFARPALIKFPGKQSWRSNQVIEITFVEYQPLSSPKAGPVNKVIGVLDVIGIDAVREILCDRIGKR